MLNQKEISVLLGQFEKQWPLPHVMRQPIWSFKGK